MYEINKIAKKSVLPKLLLAMSLSVATIGAGVYVAKQNTETVDSLAKQDKWLIMFMAAILICMYIDAYKQYKSTENLLSVVARKYLKMAAKDMPEITDFDKVLAIPTAMKDITTLISNSLRPSEQKLINDIISKALAELRVCQTSDMKNEQLFVASQKIFAQARADIVKIIREHASVHPEFINDVYSAIVYADMIYIMQPKIQQRTR